MSKPQSKNVDNPFAGRQVYEALQEPPCKKCERIIAVEEHFTRPSLGGLPVTMEPVCRQCEPIMDSPCEDRRIQTCPKNAT
jgi:hypothetical protein